MQIIWIRVSFERIRQQLQFKLQLRFDCDSAAVRLPFDSATTVRRPTSWPQPADLFQMYGSRNFESADFDQRRATASASAVLYALLDPLRPQHTPPV